ncbi:MAG: hypothetical protein GY720_14290 [bacterium]|nr:hypothetical protein [bacterium]
MTRRPLGGSVVVVVVAVVGAGTPVVVDVVVAKAAVVAVDKVVVGGGSWDVGTARSAVVGLHDAANRTIPNGSTRRKTLRDLAGKR